MLQHPPQLINIMSTLTDKEDIAKYRIYSLLRMFKLEIETGMKIRSNMSTMKFIKEHYMIDGNRKKDVYNNFLSYSYDVGVIDREKYYELKLPVR